MIEELTVRQFVTIKELQISFARGLHVFTGESGSGKSLIFDAIGLLLGLRGSTDYVRRGADKTTLEAQFSADDKCRAILAKLGITAEDGTLVIQREISRQGRNTCRVNGHLVTIANLREIGHCLANMYRQHEGQQLFQPSVYRQWLDDYLPSQGKKLLHNYRQLWYQYRLILKQLQELKTMQKDRLHKEDLYNYQLQEIQQAALKVGEEEELEEKRKKLFHVEKIKLGLEQAYTMLADDMMDPFSQSISELEKIQIYLPELEKNIKMMSECYYLLEDVMMDLRQKKDNLYYEPAELESLEERISFIQQLKRKYADSINGILEYAVTIESELEAFHHTEDRFSELEQQLQTIEEQMALLAEQLSKQREETSLVLQQQLQKELSQLQMDHHLHILTQQLPAEDGLLCRGNRYSFDEWGIDQVSFLLSDIPEEKGLSVEKVVSGGELSRFMLAIKTIFADQERMETVLFDEIDAGISGQSAQAVAEKLVELSLDGQILCISHQPQVVCMADHHYDVAKSSDGKTATETLVRILNTEDRIHALAYMLEGDRATDLTHRHAEEMIHKAQRYKEQFT